MLEAVSYDEFLKEYAFIQECVDMKKEFILKIKQLFNIELAEDFTFKNKPNVFYTKLPKHNNSLLGYLKEHYRIEEHLNNYYWIWLK